jgi:glucose/arabinose dehydrogenase
MNVTTIRKDKSHPYFGKGSALTYKITNIDVGGELTLIRGKKYVFHINTPGHPFHFTTSEAGGGAGKILSDKVMEGNLEFTPNSSTPDLIYYGCYFHPYMGGKVKIVNSSTAKGKNDENLKVLIKDLQAPVFAIPSYHDSNILFVGEQKGMIWVFDQQEKKFEQKALIDVTDYVNDLKLNDNYDERGLLGFTPHPKDKYRFFIFYLAMDNKGTQISCLSEYQSSEEEPYYCDPATERVILRIENSNSMNHKGGSIFFGKDGFIYIGIGDDATEENSQSMSDYHGKILRINPDKSVDKFNSKHIYALGFRNPWVIAQSDKGEIFAPDAASDKKEEINLVKQGSNYGWPIYEGTTLIGKESKIAFEFPILEYDYMRGGVVVGGTFINDDYYFGDFSGKVFKLIRGKKIDKKLIHQFPQGTYVRAVNKDSNDNLLILTSKEAGLKGFTGKIYTTEVK